jgi:excisionase family DNA binding protein
MYRRAATDYRLKPSGKNEEQSRRKCLCACGKQGTTEAAPEIPGEMPKTGELMSTAPQPALREVMDIRQAADYLGISGDTLYRYASEGFVPAFKLGNRWRFRKSLLDGWMDEKSGVKPVEIDPAQKKPVGRAR